MQVSEGTITQQLDELHPSESTPRDRSSSSNGAPNIDSPPSPLRFVKSDRQGMSVHDGSCGSVLLTSALNHEVSDRTMYDRVLVIKRQL